MKINFLHILWVSASLLLAACGNNKSDGFEPKIDTDVVNHDAHNESADKPVITFEETNFDFGKIKEGTKVTHTFKFKNTGEADLIIGDARGNCGCTVPKYPTQPIEPGETGVIDVEFNSAGKHGVQNKTVTLVTNSVPSTKILTITGEVTPISE
jgi:hypothetical protein